MKYLDATKDDIERGQVDEEDDRIVAYKENNVDSMEWNINDASAIELEAIDHPDAKKSKIRDEMAVFESIEKLPNHWMCFNAGKRSSLAYKIWKEDTCYSCIFG